jgi:hypothetical protein
MEARTIVQDLALRYCANDAAARGGLIWITVTQMMATMVVRNSGSLGMQ